MTFLEQGFCVVAVDANPRMAAETSSRASSHAPNVVVLNAGLDDGASKSQNLTFYINPKYGAVHSSLDFDKAQSKMGRGQKLKRATVRGMACTALWNYIPSGTELFYMKVDIEERHYVCIEALRQIPRERLPRYISWEMHEYARRLPFPVLDTELIVQMHRLGYTTMKVASNLMAAGVSGTASGKFSGGLLPENITDVVTKSTRWVPVESVLKRGLGSPRSVRPSADWWDYHMKLTPDTRAAMQTSVADVGRRLASAPIQPCGTPQAHSDCPPSYTIAAINASASLWHQCDDTWRAEYLAQRAKAEATCSTSWQTLQTGGYCLPLLDRLSDPPRIQVGRVRTVVLPNDQSYLLPYWDSKFRGANYAEADGRVVNTIVELARERFEPDQKEIFINDFGAGVGAYGHALLSLAPSLPYRGYDGAGNVANWTNGFIRWFDLTHERLTLPRAHWVMSLEACAAGLESMLLAGTLLAGGCRLLMLA